MDGVERVEQKDDTHLHWVAKIGGDKREWDAEVTEQHPDHRVAWKAIDQPGPNGVVTFHKLDEGHTKVMVQMEYDPEGMTESIGSFVGLDSHRVKGDLESFKEFIEVAPTKPAAGAATSKRTESALLVGPGWWLSRAPRRPLFSGHPAAGRRYVGTAHAACRQFRAAPGRVGSARGV